jgi:hypothetical protein
MVYIKNLHSILDKSPLENYHVSEAFNLTRKPHLNIFEKIQIDKFKFFRRRVIDCVLATDMSTHSKQVGQISSKLQFYEQNEEFCFSKIVDEKNLNLKFEIQQEFINFVLHFSDIAHPAKPWELEIKWSNLIFEEFFQQGDLEKTQNLPVSFLCDRNSINIPSSQIGFINNIVIPSVELLVRLLPSLDSYSHYVRNSLQKWKEKADEELKKEENKN